jgi:hypothetical protein
LAEIQAIYHSRSALAETMIPELLELFEVDEVEAGLYA